MNTPIVDFITQYRDSEVSRLHMPGHKGVSTLGFEPNDITEIKGADELYDADGIIAESERNATRLFGTHLTLYSTEGSSHAIRSMMILARQHYFRGSGRPLILAARNAHKAFLYAAALIDCDIEWLYPATDAVNSVAACQPTPQMLEKALISMRARMPFAVFITAPDYLGQNADIRGLSAVCKRYGLPLLVDNAHGAYLHFLESSEHPMDLGATMCCDSAHKTLPVITGGAYLHIADPGITRVNAKHIMEYTGTTSPSYLIMASLDRCNRTLAERFREQLAETIRKLEALKVRLREHGVPVIDGECLKLVINAASMGFSGTELGELLRTHKAEPEFCDVSCLVCMFAPGNSDLDYEHVYDALLEAAHMKRGPLAPISLHPTPLIRAMTVRQAAFAIHETVSTRDAVGRVCGAPTVSCPPAVPIAVSGEVITEDTLKLFEAYGIETVSVVKTD